MTSARRRRIFLVGFMGSGKTSVGAHLAQELACRFVDLDREIEHVSGLSIAEIFAREGEPAFRRFESLALREAGALHDVVVATGGGTLTRWENRDFIQRSGLTVWLDAPLEVMLERCRDGARRPLLGPPEQMEALLAQRIGYYRGADLRVEAGAGSPEEVARYIAARLGDLA